MQRKRYQFHTMLCYCLYKLVMALLQGSQREFIVLVIMLSAILANVYNLHKVDSSIIYQFLLLIIEVSFLWVGYLQQDLHTAVGVMYFLSEQRLLQPQGSNWTRRIKLSQSVVSSVVVIGSTLNVGLSWSHITETCVLIILVSVHKLINYSSLRACDKATQIYQSVQEQDCEHQLLPQTPHLGQSEPIMRVIISEEDHLRDFVQSSFRVLPAVGLLHRLFPPLSQSDQLRVLESMIHRSFDSLSCGIVLMNREAEIAFANRKAHALLSTSNIRQIQAAIEKLLREYYLSEPENLEQDEDSVEPGAASNSNIPSLFGPNLSFQLQSRFSRLTSRQHRHQSLQDVIRQADTIELILERQGNNIEILPKSDTFIMINNFSSASMSFNEDITRSRKCIRLRIQPLSVPLTDMGYTLLILENKTHKQTNQENQLQQHINNLLLNSYSHELKTPLNCSQQYLDNLMERYQHDQDLVDNFVIPIMRQQELLLHQIGDILDYAQLQTHRFRYNDCEFNLIQTIQRIARIYEPSFREKGINFTLNLQVVRTKVVNDENRFSQVLVNLINNALKFTQVGGNVSIQLTEHVATRILYNLAVNDDGVGIDPVRLKHIQRVLNDKSYKDRTHVGMGLKIANQIIQGFVDESYQPNQLRIESKGQVGTKVEFLMQDKNHFRSTLINFEKEDETSNLQTLSTPAMQMQSLKTKSLSMKTKTFSANKSIQCRCDQVLLVDDVAFNLIPLKQHLDTQKVSYQTCYNGEDAVTMVQTKLKPRACQESEQCRPAFKLILMDIDMPTMDGIEATRQIRNIIRDNDLDTVVVMCSAFNGHKEREDAFRAGATDFISKPVKKAHLRDVLQRYVLDEDVQQ